MYDNTAYHAYLCTPEWHEKKAQCIKLAKGKCQNCGVRPADKAHHITYATLYNETMEDLLAVCNLCHAFLHGKTRDFELL